MSATVLLFLCVLGLSLAQCTQWQSSFNQSSVFSTGYGAVGVNQGTFSFNWNTFKMSIVYTGTQLWEEYFEFNSNRGETNFADQKLSSYGRSCDPVCGVSALSAAMPPLGPVGGGRFTKGTLVSGTTCYRYTINTNTPVANFTMKDNGEVCSVTMKDNRIFTLTGLTCLTGSSPAITIPANCSCKGKADIWIMVDHSGSISESEMKNFKTQFVQPFLSKLAISPDEINVGMSWFHTSTGLNFPLTGSLNDLNAGMEAWFINCSSYNDNNRPNVCTSGNTATATGLRGWTAGNQQTTSNCHSFDTKPTNTIPPGTPTDRIVGATEWFMSQAGRQVPKLFITLTDGAMNVLRQPVRRCNSNSNTNCGCYNACSGDGCASDLTAAVQDLQTQTAAKFPSQALTLISVGIGSTCGDPDQCLSIPHLTTLAGGKSENVLRIESFNADQLTKAVQNLVLLSCPAENNQLNKDCIQTCCGLCVCGRCQAPTVTTCTNNNLCTKTTFNGFCCNSDTNIPLPSQCARVPAGNSCNVTSCDADANGGRGACAWAPIDCSGSSVGCETRTCDPASQQGSCTIPNRTACPAVICTYGEWSAWGNCLVTCGGSTQTRTRSVNRTAQDGGADCDPAAATETQPCGTACCPVACSWNAWQPWGNCTQECGRGQRTANRTQVAALCNGAACSNVPNGASRTEDCNTQCCRVDCTWSAWADWETCSRGCGGGTQQRRRNQNVHPTCPGTACSGTALENQACNTQNCPINCTGFWTEWGTDCPCNATDPASSASTKYRYYTITRPAQYNGSDCPAADGANESTPCVADPTACVTVNCSGYWLYTNCTCDIPTRTTTYVITVRASGPNATDCPETAGLKNTTICDCGEGTSDFCAPYCPIDCEGYHTEWSNCSCVTNQQNRTFIITKAANHSGRECPEANNTPSVQNCTPICPVPCVGEFKQSPCDCIIKNRTEQYEITTPARDGGLACPHADGFQRQLVCVPSELTFCPTPCIGNWTEWSACDCDFFNQSRTYVITKNATNGGASCARDDGTVESNVCTPRPNDCPPVNPKCLVPGDCNDGNMCTEDRCVLQPRGISRCDWSVNVTCNDESGCTADSCDPLVGCVYTTTVFCNDNSVCTNETCHPTRGCQYTNLICPNRDVCFLGNCHPVQGCGTAARACNNSGNCSYAQCDVNYTQNGRAEPCYEIFTCPPSLGLIAGISAGAAVAIAVCAALVALAVLGGGSYALASQMAQDDDTIITKNPMFQAKGTSGTNPLNVE